MINNIIPPNTKGKQTDVERTVTLPNREEALDAFKRAYKRMLNVNIWHGLIGAASAGFLLVDAHGNELNRLAEVNDYITIDIPGPGPSLGKGLDWVTIEVLENNTDPAGNEEAMGIRMRSCKNPGEPGNDTAHFFTGDATSTIIISRSNNTVVAAYHGRNEVLNIKTDSIADNIRNAVIGAGAVIGLSELQWTTLIKSLLRKEV